MNEAINTRDLAIETTNQSFSQNADYNLPVLKDGDEIIELNDGFDFDGYQVVRREFFAHIHEPSVTFNNCRFYVNKACLNKFPDVEYIQVLINRESHILALRPCEEGARDSFAWCRESKGKRQPKQTTCRLFFAKIFDLMDWNPDYRYKMLGRLIHANNEYLLAFDLSSSEVYQRTYSEDSKPKMSRTPVYPASWQNQFGLPYKEHRQSMQINIFDGYAIYSIKDSTKVSERVKTTSADTNSDETSYAESGGIVNEQ